MKSENFSIILKQLASLYETFFSTTISDYSIFNDPDFPKAPITYRGAKEIILCCCLENNYQIAFQLSHELCHASIPSDVPASFRWLEEVFAVLSSYLFPCKISLIRPEKYRAYFRRSFSSYRSNCEISSQKLSVKSLSLLEAGSGTHNYTDYGSYYKIGKNLLPLVQNNPAIWEAVPYLCQIPENLSSIDSYFAWRRLLPSDISYIVSVVVGPLFF